MALAAIDCAAWDGQEVCRSYHIKGFPTLRVLLRVFNKLLFNLIFMQFIGRLGEIRQKTWSISLVGPLKRDSVGDLHFSPSEIFCEVWLNFPLSGFLAEWHDFK